MVQIIRQPLHTHEVITKDGEIKILLEITLNINSNNSTIQAVEQDKQKEDVRWAIPNFKTDNKIKFGKKVEES